MKKILSCTLCLLLFAFWGCDEESSFPSSDSVDDLGRHGVISDHWMDLLLWWRGFLLSEDPARSAAGYFQVYNHTQ